MPGPALAAGLTSRPGNSKNSWEQMSSWYYADRARQRYGPMEGAAVAQHVREGRIGLDALVWREGLVQWQPLGEMTAELGLLADAPPAPPAAPA